MYGPPRLQQPTGTKRSRPDDLESEMEGLPGQQMQMGEMGGMSSQMPPQSMVGVGGYSAQQPIQYHTHPLPNQGHRSKMPRMSEGDPMVGPSGGAPSVVGLEGMPQPAPRPRGPKLKFTPEDDGLLVDLKENKSLTWKQIAEFFPGRSSGTLQVRYCTKLKAKTTQWTDETVSFFDLFRCASKILTLTFLSRSKNFGRLFTITSRKSGALWHKRLARASHRLLARRKPENYSRARLQQKLTTLLILGTPNTSSRYEHGIVDVFSCLDLAITAVF